MRLELPTTKLSNVKVRFRLSLNGVSCLTATDFLKSSSPTISRLIDEANIPERISSMSFWLFLIVSTLNENGVVIITLLLLMDAIFALRKTDSMITLSILRSSGKFCFSKVSRHNCQILLLSLIF